MREINDKRNSTSLEQNAGKLTRIMSELEKRRQKQQEVRLDKMGDRLEKAGQRHAELKKKNSAVIFLLHRRELNRLNDRFDNEQRIIVERVEVTNDDSKLSNDSISYERKKKAIYRQDSDKTVIIANSDNNAQFDEEKKWLSLKSY